MMMMIGMAMMIEHCCLSVLADRIVLPVCVCVCAHFSALTRRDRHAMRRSYLSGDDDKQEDEDDDDDDEDDNLVVGVSRHKRNRTESPLCH